MQNNYDIFRDSFLIFFDYINRQLKKNPDYEFHPLIKALMNGLQGVEKIKVGEHCLGLSGESKKGKFFNPYTVVLEKHDHGIEIKEIRELTTNSIVPLDVIVLIFRLQIQLDKFPEDSISAKQSTEVFNTVLPEFHFYNLGDKWKEARDLFAKRLKEGKVYMPSSFKTKGLDKEFAEIRYDTPWEKYPPQIRSLIAGFSADIFDSRSNTIVMSTPLEERVPKYKIFEFASQILMGKGAEYMEDKDCIFCKRKNVEDYVLSVENDFIILADRYPLQYGHLLILPKKHVKAMGDLPMPQLVELEEIIRKISKFYIAKKEDFVMFEPGFAGQTIYHAHIHFLPGIYFIEQAIKTYGMAFEEIQDLSDIVNKYKNHGRYFLWMTNGKKFIAFPTKELPRNSFFRTLVAGQILDSALADWRKLSENKEYLNRFQEQINKLKRDWNKL